MIGIVIVTYESERDIEYCLRSIAYLTHIPYELVIVDNGSNDSTVAITQATLDCFDDSSCQRVQPVFLSDNTGYAPAINRGFELLSSDTQHIVFLNPDTIVSEKWLQRLRGRFKDKVGIVGPLSDTTAGFQKITYWLDGIDIVEHEALRYEAGTDIQHFAQGIAQHFAGQTAQVKFISGFCLMTSRSIIEELGALNNSFYLGIDDLEFCLRVRSAGYDLCVACDVFVYHRGGSSILSFPRKQYQQLHKQMGAHFCSLLTEQYNGAIPSSDELFGFTLFDPREFAPGAPYPSLQWQEKLVSLDGQTLVKMRELA